MKRADIDSQLARILASPAFARSPRSTEFLRFCVERGAGDEAPHLKETTIAVEVFHRPPDYDPKTDPIVRVHARRVREKLALYYRTEGNADPVRIELPKGQYVPQFSRALPSRKTDFSDWRPEDVQLQEAADLPAPLAVAPRAGRRGWLGLLVIAVAVASFTLAWMLRGQPIAAARPLVRLQTMDLPGSLSDPAWSPDGRRLAYTGSDAAGGATHIYVATPGSGRPPVRLTHGDAAEMRPAWSPDGSEVAFLRSVDLSHFEVLRLRLADGTSTSLGRFNAMAYVMEEHPALDWSPDGKALLTTEQMSGSSPMRLVQISLADGQRTPLTSPPSGSTGDIDAKFSPDGNWIAFRRGGQGDLYVVPAKGEQYQQATRLTFDMRGVRGIAWGDHGASILFGSQRGPSNAYGVWKIARTGGAPEPLTPGDFDAVGPAVAASGALAVTHRQLVTELALHTLDGSKAERALTAPEQVDGSPVFSPDGRSVAFVSTRSGWEEVWLYREGAKSVTQLTHFGGAGWVLYPTWSPDGRSIAFSRRENGATNIFTYSVPDGALKQITATRNRDISPVYSADGQYLYYSSNDDGTSRIWRVRTDGADHAEPLFWEAVIGFLPSADGRWMYFVEGGPALTVVRRSLVDGSTEEVYRAQGSASFANGLAVANGQIYLGVSTDDTSRSEIVRIDPATKRATPVAHLTGLPPFEVAGFSVSPDGRSLVAAEVAHSESSLYASR